MPSSIEFEKERIQKDLSVFKSFLRELKADTYDTTQFKRLRQAVSQISDAFEKTISARLAAIPSAYAPEDVSTRIDELRKAINSLYNMLYITIFKNMDVPPELYYFTDHCLENCSVKANYVLCLGETIQTQNLEWLLRDFKSIYPEFWEEVQHVKFYSVHFIRRLADRNSSLDWSLLVHEMGHIVDIETGLIDKMMPGVDYYSAYQLVLADKTGDPGYDKSKKRVLVGEYLADFISTQCLGGAFGWRFLKEFMTLENIFEDQRTHPDLNPRIREMINQINDQLSLPMISKILESELTMRLKELNEVRTPFKRDYVELEDAFRRAAKLINFSATRDAIKNLLKEKLVGTPARKIDNDFDRVLMNLQRNFLRGRPIVVEPALLYLIYMYGIDNRSLVKERAKNFETGATELNLEQSDFEGLVQELIADCIKLHAVAEKYQRKIPSVPPIPS